jgi:hypothetical protein
LADTVVEKNVSGTAYKYKFTNILRHITCVKADDDDGDDDMHRFACAVNYILEMWCSYI